MFALLAVIAILFDIIWAAGALSSITPFLFAVLNIAVFLIMLLLRYVPAIDRWAP